MLALPLLISRAPKIQMSPPARPFDDQLEEVDHYRTLDEQDHAQQARLASRYRTHVREQREALDQLLSAGEIEPSEWRDGNRDSLRSSDSQSCTLRLQRWFRGFGPRPCRLDAFFESLAFQYGIYQDALSQAPASTQAQIREAAAAPPTYQESLHQSVVASFLDLPNSPTSATDDINEEDCPNPHPQAVGLENHSPGLVDRILSRDGNSTYDYQQPDGPLTTNHRPPTYSPADYPSPGARPLNSQIASNLHDYGPQITTLPPDSAANPVEMDRANQAASRQHTNALLPAANANYPIPPIALPPTYNFAQGVRAALLPYPRNAAEGMALLRGQAGFDEEVEGEEEDER